MLVVNGVLYDVSEADINVNGTIDFPKGCTAIGENAFAYCSSLAALTIPDSVTSISFRAFYRCSSLITLTIPYGVTWIDDSAFECCDNVEDIFIVVKPSGSTAEEMAKNQLVQFERVAKLFPKNLQDKIKEENLVSFLVSLAASHCGNDSPQQTGQPSTGVTGALGLFSATPERKSSGESSTPEDANTIKP